jgi:hypothetical protein
MYTIVLRLTRTKEPEASNDDKIIVQHNTTYPNLFDVTYTTPELKVARKFTADESDVMDFFSDTLRGVQTDTDPFGYVQICTAIHPSFIFKVREFDCEIRCNIMNMIRFALRADVRQKRISSE